MKDEEEEEKERYKRAKARVAELRGFYEHLAAYLVVNLMLIVINLVTSPQSLWFYWVTIFWGFAVIWHAVNVFGKYRVLTKAWEEKKIKEIMEKEKKK